MTNPRQAGRAAFTLVEMIATVTILGIIGAATLPVIESAGTLYAESASMSRSVERASFAIDRASRVLREIPITDTNSGLAIEHVRSDSIALASGDSLALSDGRLVITKDGRTAVLCSDVSRFEIIALGADGITRTEGSPEDTRRIMLSLVADGVEIRTSVFPRAAMGVLP